ncbi:hypothetical protein [Gloeocapsopsis sp. IPPAS B-1203]|uniref:hypothetical protein n=1 Tax=Gloeocapsopsis sp. IPPAS B-1203 TaxID=2049454 RepID=UPI000C19789D|nr:hypothetical protein [Gloeocapsopsis sp. IPPAS B-1203]PIG95051.1 hypothetical protein CSQ79_00830 [Gloeocapsopsis sp. IPPAS B-1203]
MPSKRSKQKNVQRFYCPKCDRRLWRVGSLKYFLSHTGVLENQRCVKISHQGALLVAAKEVCVDGNSWIEEFVCGEHGTLWMKLDKQADGSLGTSLATTHDWRLTNYTLQPETSHPSIKL